MSLIKAAVIVCDVILAGTGTNDVSGKTRSITAAAQWGANVEDGHVL